MELLYALVPGLHTEGTGPDAPDADGSSQLESPGTARELWVVIAAPELFRVTGDPVRVIGVLAAEYTLGCANAAYYNITQLRIGGDIRDLGSGTAGATNAGRVLGRRGFATVFFLDLAKGIAAVVLARLSGSGPAPEAAAEWTVVAGHVWPVQLRFLGGKGIATMLGVLLASQPASLLAPLVGWMPAFWIFRRCVLVGLSATPLLPAAIGPSPWGASGASGLVVMIWWTHRGYVRRQWRVRFPGAGRRGGVAGSVRQP